MKAKIRGVLIESSDKSSKKELFYVSQPMTVQAKFLDW